MLLRLPMSLLAVVLQVVYWYGCDGTAIGAGDAVAVPAVTVVAHFQAPWFRAAAELTFVLLVVFTVALTSATVVTASRPKPHMLTPCTVGARVTATALNAQRLNYSNA